ncbi:MAG: DUF2799 domain-containing protein [Gammaproteobacteria bacterium]|nr:DUF2799 domain-containing protein [Gammaproteobacteria bacterium]
MRQRLALGSILLSGLFLGGCATTMDQAECLTADWYSIGIEDGSRGQTMDRLTRHRKQCSEFGVQPDVQAYQQGRYEGLDYFCTLPNGLEVGKRGQTYHNVCPAEMQYYFLTGYRLGREIHRVRTDMRRNRSQVRNVEEELASAETTAERKGELRYQLRTMEQEFGRLQSRVEYLEQEERRVVVSKPSPMAKTN